jgi:hypothetical protein
MYMFNVLLVEGGFVFILIIGNIESWGVFSHSWSYGIGLGLERKMREFIEGNRTSVGKSIIFLHRILFTQSDPVLYHLNVLQG